MSRYGYTYAQWLAQRASASSSIAPGLGLALGGGGLRGVAHIGVLRVLAENGIRPDLIAGTSAGALVAALYAAGLEPAEMLEMVGKLKPGDVYDCALNPVSGFQLAASLAHHYLHIPMPPQRDAPLGLLRGDRLERLLREKTQNRDFTQAKLPVAITAVDINSGQLVVFCRERNMYPDASGDTIFITGATLAEAARASSAVPGVFAPKAIDGRMLVDGGVRNVVPADVLRRMGAKRVIAVDLGHSQHISSEVGDIVEIICEAVDIMGRALTDRILRRSADLVITPEIGDVDLADIKRIPDMIAEGEAAATLALPYVRRLVV